jgi:biotin-[acetyl-CoA-carboxylase] ligase BirA-like protein
MNEGLLIFDQGARPFVPAEVRAAAVRDLSREDRELFELAGGHGPSFGVADAFPGWHRVVVVETSPGSQFDALTSMLSAETTPAGPVALLAISGREFHGHRGRAWSAERGNVHLSAALCPREFPARDALAFVMLPAVAVVDAIRSVTANRLSPRIKWVNDILLDGRKVAGVLTATASRQDHLAHAVVGVGLNVESRPEVAPTPFVPGVTSLVEQGENTTHADLLRPLLDRVLGRYQALLESGPAALLTAYRENSGVVGRVVTVYPEGIDEQSPRDSWPHALARGRVESIGDDLSLRIAGLEDPVTRGRLILEA